MLPGEDLLRCFAMLVQWPREDESAMRSVSVIYDAGGANKVAVQVLVIPAENVAIMCTRFPGPVRSRGTYLVKEPEGKPGPEADVRVHAGNDKDRGQSIKEEFAKFKLIDKN